MDAVISIKGLIGTDEDIELVSAGTYEYAPDRVRFSYLESELTGLDGVTTLFNVTPGLVVISRSGGVSMDMIFSEGEKEYFAYNTPYGAATIGLETIAILNSLGERGGVLEVRYLIDMQDQMAVKTRFIINISATEEKA